VLFEGIGLMFTDVNVFNFSLQSLGGDPVVAEVVDSEGRRLAVKVLDKGNGSYEAKFTPPKEGTYCLKVTYFKCS